MSEDMKQFLVKIAIGDKASFDSGIAVEYPSAGSEFFRSLYSATGASPATHAILSWGLTLANKDEVLAFLTSDFSGLFEWAFVDFENAQDYIATTWGLKPCVADDQI